MNKELVKAFKKYESIGITKNYEDIKIPKVNFPSISSYTVKVVEEDLVDLARFGETFVFEPYYYNQGIPGATRSCFLRKTAANKLLKASSLLPKGLKLKVYDGWRPYAVQNRLWKHYFMDIKNDPKNKGLSDAEIEKLTSFFVSKPSTDIKIPFLHGTGGAVDVTLVDSNGHELDMGTKFDDFSNKAWTNHFEGTEETDIIKNRRILYHTMLGAGFTNLPSEWWHYDYGTKFWGYFKKTDVLYDGILYIEDKIEVFPLS